MWRAGRRARPFAVAHHSAPAGRRRVRRAQCRGRPAVGGGGPALGGSATDGSPLAAAGYSCRGGGCDPRQDDGSLGLRDRGRACRGVRALGRRRHVEPVERRRGRSRLGPAVDGLGLRALRRRVHRFRAVPGLQSLRLAAPRQGHRQAGVPDVVVGRDDVQRGHGHRAHVLRRRRADLASRRPSPGPRAPRHAPMRRGSRCSTRISIGGSRVVPVRHRRLGAGLLQPARACPTPSARPSTR
jgi:hypothetical protein